MGGKWGVMGGSGSDPQSINKIKLFYTHKLIFLGTRDVNGRQMGDRWELNWSEMGIKWGVMGGSGSDPQSIDKIK